MSPADGSPRRSLSRQLVRAGILLAAGLVLLWALLRHTGVEQVKAELVGADRRLLAIAAAVHLSQSLTVGLRWWLAVRLCGYPGRLVSLLRGAAASQVINFVAPGHFGEPAASAWLGRTGRAPGVEVFGLLVATKAVASLLNITVLMACLVLLVTEVDPEALPQAGLITALAFALAAAAFVAILHPGIAGWGTRLLARVTKIAVSTVDRGEPAEPRSVRASRWVEAFCGRFRASFVLLARSPAALGATSALSVVKIASMMVVVWLLYSALGAAVSPAAATFVGTADAPGNMAAVWVPGNLGVQEAVHSSAAAGALGIEPAVAVSASLLVKALMVLHALVGVVLFVALAPLDVILGGSHE